MTGTTSRVVLAVATACSLALAAPGAARAEEPVVDPAYIQAVYDNAMEAYRAGRFAEAARGFEKANGLQPDVALLWNIGRSWEQAGELEKARQAYTDFLGAEGASPDLRMKVADALVRVGAKIQARKAARTQEERIEQLRRELAEAERERNDELIEKLEAQLAAEEGTEPPRKDPVADARPATTAPDPGPTTLEAKAEPARTAPSPVSWVMLGLGVVSAGAGTWLLLDAENRRDTVRTGISSAPGGLVVDLSRADALRLESDADRNATLGVAALGVGGALVVTGVVMAIVTRGEAEPAVSFGAQPHRGAALLSAAGRF